MDANAGQKDGTLRKIIDMCGEKYGHYRQILDDLVDEVLDSEEEGDDFCVPSEEPVSVELGRFECYEVKSCLADFESGHGLTFYGDLNYLVTTVELAETLRVSHRLPRNIDQVLVPSKKGDKLRPLYDMTGNGSPSYRHRPASEMLYAMIEADGQRTRWKMIRGSSRNITS